MKITKNEYALISRVLQTFEKSVLGEVANGCNPRTWEVKARGVKITVSYIRNLSLRPALATSDPASKR